MTTLYTYARYSLEADCLASETEVPEGLLACACGRLRSASELFDASDYDELVGDWRCIICFSAIDRAEAIAADQASAPAPSWSPDCQHGNAIRAERWRLLMDSDWTEFPRSPLTEAQRDEWGDYRQALRDLTATFACPTEVIWPTPPA